MRAPVPLQLVRPGEALPAVEPVADEGSLSTVPSQVGTQVGRLAVYLAATRNVAYVLLLARLAIGISASSWRKKKIATITYNKNCIHLFFSRKNLAIQQRTETYFDLDLSPSLQLGQVHATRLNRVLATGAAATAEDEDADCPDRDTPAIDGAAATAVGAVAIA